MRGARNKDQTRTDQRTDQGPIKGRRGRLNKLNKEKEGSGDTYITGMASDLRVKVDKRTEKAAADKVKADAKAAKEKAAKEKAAA